MSAQYAASGSREAPYYNNPPTQYAGAGRSSDMQYRGDPRIQEHAASRNSVPYPGPSVGPGLYPSPYSSPPPHAYQNTRSGLAYPGGSNATSSSHAVPHGAVGEAESPTGEHGSKTRYECSYCGKGFLRPSALKASREICWLLSWSIADPKLPDPPHIAHRRQRYTFSCRMHTHIAHLLCPPDFVCPHERCGRRFGVRSNMLRHIRLVHQQNAEDADSRDWEPHNF